MLRRLNAAGTGGHGAPLFVFDAGYSAAALTAGLLGCLVHVLARLPVTSVFYYDPASWPGKNGRPGKYGLPVRCHKADDADQSDPEPDESLTLPGTPLYGTVQVDAWRGVHPQIHGDRGWFADWDSQEASLRPSSQTLPPRAPDGRDRLLDSA